MPFFRFEWSPLNHKDESVNIVETYDKHLMNIFLQQHGFDPENARVQIIDDTDDKVDECQLLREYRFGTRNPDKRLYKIITTHEMVTGIAEAVAEELSDTMMLGACALRKDIQLFDRISELINQLSYIYILEESVASSDDSEDYDYTDGYPYYEGIAINQDLSYLYDSLMTESHWSRDVQPITVETYVSAFVRIFLLGA